MAILNPKAVLQTSSGGGGTAGVSSLNGESGALSLKTIGGQDPLGVGDIPTGSSGGTIIGSRVVDTNTFKRFRAGGNATTTQALSNNMVFLLQISPQTSFNLTEFGVFIGNATAAGLFRIFIFGSQTDGSVDLSAPLFSSVELSAATVGLKAVTANIDLVQGEQYYLAIWGGGASINVRATPLDSVTFWDGNSVNNLELFILSQTYSSTGSPSGTPTRLSGSTNMNCWLYKDGSTS